MYLTNIDLQNSTQTAVVNVKLVEPFLTKVKLVFLNTNNIRFIVFLLIRFLLILSLPIGVYKTEHVKFDSFKCIKSYLGDFD